MPRIRDNTNRPEECTFQEADLMLADAIRQLDEVIGGQRDCIRSSNVTHFSTSKSLQKLPTTSQTPPLSTIFPELLTFRSMANDVRVTNPPKLIPGNETTDASDDVRNNNNSDIERNKEGGSLEAVSNVRKESQSSAEQNGNFDDGVINGGLDLGCSEKAPVWNWSSSNNTINNASGHGHPIRQTNPTTEVLKAKAGERSSGSSEGSAAQTSSSSSDLPESPTSSTSSSILLSKNPTKNLDKFLKAIDQLSMTAPADTDARMKILQWLGTSLANAASTPQQTINTCELGKSKKRSAAILAPSELLSPSAFSIPSYAKRSSELRESASTMTTVASSPSFSRPMLPYSDSGFSSDSGFCAFLPPPPPYRPPRCASDCGSDGAITCAVGSGSRPQLSQNVSSVTGGGGHQDFTSLLGFDTLTRGLKMPGYLATVDAIEAIFGAGNESEYQQQKSTMRRSLSDSKYRKRDKRGGVRRPLARGFRPEQGQLLPVASAGSCLAVAATDPSDGGGGDKRLSGSTTSVGDKVVATAEDAPPVEIVTTFYSPRTLQMEQEQQRDVACDNPRIKATTHLALATSTDNLQKQQLQEHRSSSHRSLAKVSPSPVSMSTAASCTEYPELQEKLHRLTISRDSLSLQVSILNQQVNAQKEKIRDLEVLLEAKQQVSNCVNSQQLRNLSPGRPPSGDKQLELASELCELRSQCSSLERNRNDAERRLQMSHNELERLSQSLGTHSQNPSSEVERLQLAVQRLIADNEQKNLEISSLRNALDEQAAKGNRRSGSPRRPAPPPQMQSAREGHAPPLRAQSQPQQQQQSFDINEQLRRILLMDDEDSGKDQLAHSLSFPTSLYRHSSSPAAPGGLPPQGAGVFSPRGYLLDGGAAVPPPALHPSVSYHSALSSSAAALPPPLWRVASPPRGDQLDHHQHFLMEQQQQQFCDNGRTIYSQPSTAIPPALSSSFTAANFQQRPPASPLARQLAAELDEIRRNDYPHLYYLHKNGTIGTTQPQQHQYQVPFATSSLPRSLHSKANGHHHHHHHNQQSGYKHSMVSSRNGNVESDDESGRGRGSMGPQTSASANSNSNFKRNRTRSTLRNFLGRFSHNNQKGTSLQDLRRPKFTPRDTIRSSTSSRGLSTAASAASPVQVVARPSVLEFVDWTGDLCSRWLRLVGFGDYAPTAARFVQSGRHLLNMTAVEYEKELGIRSHMHRKRLRCLLDCIERNEQGNHVEPADRMDIHQVMLWLDEIGMPQLRDTFADNLVDGQMLLCMTAQDLVELKITSALNHATIARAIQFLRSVDFCAHRLEKHFVPEWLNHGPIPAEVERWSHGCTVEWLRSIDLAEFTPNLAFSGLHGALMVYEATFTAESLAEMLQIPAHKTLLRRHLSTNFSNILGQDIVNHKREMLTQPSVTYLTPALRIKLVSKKGFSLARKKSRTDIWVEPDVRVCQPSGCNGVALKQQQQNATDESGNSLENSDV